MNQQQSSNVLQSDNFQQALQQHQTGNIAEAMQHYQALLQEHPNESQILYLLGTGYCQTGKSQQAIETLQQSLKINPSNPFAYNNLGNAFKDQQLKDEALNCYNHAVRLKADYESAFFNRAVLLRELQRCDESLASFQEAIRLKPNYIEALRECGNLLRDMNRDEEALERYAQALQIDGQNIEVFFQRAVTFKKLGRLYQAIESYNDMLKIQPDHTNALFNRGNLYLSLGKNKKAAESFTLAIQFNPEYADAYLNRGNAHKLLGQMQASLEDYSKAIQLKSDYTEAFSNRGNLHKDCGRVDLALADYEQALTFQPEFAEVQWNRAILLIVKGEYLAGWQAYEWRLRMPSYQINCMKFDRPEWRDLAEIKNKTVLVYPEQGFGDAIQFCRYLIDLSKLCKKLILVMHQSLVSLMNTLPCELSITVKGDPVPEFDMYCPLMSMPYIFKTTLQTIPAKIPYLFADTARVTQWQQRFSQSSKRKVGLAWSGSIKHENDAQRSIPLQALSALLGQVEQVEWHSLHKEYRLQDQAAINQHAHLIHHGNELNDFADTAALIECLDLVITVDTSVAHLAGALGKPVWILLPFAPDYRWGLQQPQTPWYPTARLFRQTSYANWESILQTLAYQLQLWIGQQQLSINADSPIAISDTTKVISKKSAKKAK